jgi:tRNA pseudouridine38-40 synthase
MNNYKMCRCRLFILFAATVATIKAIRPAERLVRYRARVAYDGHGFAGFQLQTRKNCRTVQGALEDVINRRLLGSVKVTHQDRMIKVVAASRTDAGVHARGQAIHFDVPSRVRIKNVDLAHLCHSLNDMISTDISIWNLQRAPSTVMKPISQSKFEMKGVIEVEYGEYQWNVLFDSTKKLYSYRLSLAPVMDPIQRWTRWHPPHATEINIDLLTSVLSNYIGTHDFRAFAGAIERTEKCSGISISTIRTVFSVNIIKEDDLGNYRIDFVIKGALYKQIRNMVGTALDVSRGELSYKDFLRLLRQDCTLTRIDNCCRPAPPEGLSLEYVFFDDQEF